MTALWPLVVGASAPCVVRGQASFGRAEPVTVRPRGGDPFTLHLLDVQLVVTLPYKARRPAVLQVEGPIAFRAEHRNLWLQVKRDVRTRDGLVTLRRGAWLANPRVVDGGAVMAHAALDPEAYEAYDDDSIVPNEAVTNVRVPCSALAVRLADAPSLWEDSLEIGESVQLYELLGTKGQLRLRVRPEKGAFARTIRSPSCPDCVTVTVVRRQGDWRLVERKAFGVTARGWVRRSELRAIDMDAYGIGMRSSPGGSSHGWGESKPEGRILYEGAATVRAGAPVFARGGETSWGTFTRETEVELRHVEDEARARLRKVPGIAGDPPRAPLFDAWVRLEDVVFHPPPPQVPPGPRPEPEEDDSEEAP